MLILEIALGVAFGLAFAPYATQMMRWCWPPGLTFGERIGRTLVHPLTLFLLLLLAGLLRVSFSSRP